MNDTTKHKVRKDGMFSAAIKDVEKFCLKLERVKKIYDASYQKRREKKLNTIQNIKRLDLSYSIKHELESMLYNDLEDGDKHKFFPN
jgi:hypothetical protein